MSFPSSIPSYNGFTSTHTLQQDTHAAQHNQEQADIVALATKLGTGSATAGNNTVLRGNGSGTTTFDQVHLATDVTGTLPTANGGTGTTSTTGTGSVVFGTSPTIATPTISNPTITGATLAGFQSLLGLIYPVGCIYTETTGTNPGTTFGVGTWAAYGAGRVLVGNGTSDQTFAAGATGGESNHTLSISEMPSHTHDMRMKDDGSTVTNSLASWTSGHTWDFDSTTTSFGGTGTGDHKSHPTGGGSSHNNLQPYIVVYFWQRTA